MSSSTFKSRHHEVFKLSYPLARVRPTPYIVGGFLGYFADCKHALLITAREAGKIEQLRYFFNVILLDPNSGEEMNYDSEILDEAIVMGEVSCTDESAPPESIVRMVRRSRLGVIAARGVLEPVELANRFSRSLERVGVAPAFIGSTHTGRSGDSCVIAIIDNRGLTRYPAGRFGPRPPSSFSVAAIVSVFNEVDIIVCSLEKLLAQGIEVYLIDNWSTDGTYETVVDVLRPRLAGLERFPIARPHESFDLYSLLTRKEEIMKTLQADWIIHCDADDILCAPWPGVSLRDGIYRVDQEGYNAINHTVVEFHPVDNGFHQGTDFEDYFRYFTFGAQPADFVHVSAWKNTGCPISLAARAGYQVSFEGRRIYPYNFLSKQYPIRSQEHGARKVFCDRHQRTFPAARPRWWHTNYDAPSENCSFLKDPSALAYFDPNRFFDQYLVERLTGIGTLLPHSAD